MSNTGYRLKKGKGSKASPCYTDLVKQAGHLTDNELVALLEDTVTKLLYEGCNASAATVKEAIHRLSR